MPGAVSCGLVLEKSGNFSIYDRANGVVYITPSGIFREVLTAEQVVLVDLDNQLGVPASLIGTLMHLEIYKARDESMLLSIPIRVCHALCRANKPIEPAESLTWAGVDVAPFALPGTPELARNVPRLWAGKCGVVETMGLPVLAAT